MSLGYLKSHQHHRLVYMVSIKKHYVLFHSSLSFQRIVTVCHLPDFWQILSYFLMTFTLASHTTRRASSKQNIKPKRTSDFLPVIWKRQEATKAVTVLMAFISKFHSLTALWEIYESLWDFLKSSEWPSHQNEISQLLLALRIYLHACCSI